MQSAEAFVGELGEHVGTMLARLDLLKDRKTGLPGRPEIVRRLKLALRNELEASELAASWMPSTPETDVKLGLARQVGDEARHYRLIEARLLEMGADLSGFNALEGGYSPMFRMLGELASTVERVAAAQFTREALALKKNEQFIEFCVAARDADTAALYREHIQPDEQWHVELGRAVLRKHAVTAELQAKARGAVDAVLELAVKIQTKQLDEMKISHAPGC